LGVAGGDAPIQAAAGHGGGDAPPGDTNQNAETQNAKPQNPAQASAAGSQATSVSTAGAGQTPTLGAIAAAQPQAPIVALGPSTPTPADAPATPTAATVADLATQTAAQVSQGASQFQITLTPEGLGQVSVTVSVAAEGKVSAAFAFEKPETAEALSGRASDLQKALEQAGFNVSDSGLTFALATPTGHGQGANADQNPGGASGQGGMQQGSSQGGSGQGGSGQGGSGQGGSGQGSNTGFTQTANQGSSQGDSGGQGQSWTYGQAGALAFASASDAAAAVDQPPRSLYASRSASGLDIRI